MLEDRSHREAPHFRWGNQQADSPNAPPLSLDATNYGKSPELNHAAGTSLCWGSLPPNNSKPLSLESCKENHHPEQAMPSKHLKLIKVQ